MIFKCINLQYEDELHNIKIIITIIIIVKFSQIKIFVSTNFEENLTYIANFIIHQCSNFIGALSDKK